MRSTNFILLLYAFSIAISLFSCSDDGEVKQPKDCEDATFFCEVEKRNFSMGFSTWPYAPTLASVSTTYAFIRDNSDLYSEHVDSNIPWKAWMNDEPLPTSFINEINGKVEKKITGKKLTVSVSLLNSVRDELAFDFDGSVPEYTAMNDAHIEEAYFKHLDYITKQLTPDYLILAIEVNELLKNSPEKWDGYKLLMENIRRRVKQTFPALIISESITLHNFYAPDVANPEPYISEIADYANGQALVTISFYPFFKGLRSKSEFQQAFDFLHDKIQSPIAFSETSHLSEDLSISAFDLFIASNASAQNAYLESLCTNAQTHDYEYIIWWAHRDYNELWEIFPEEAKDLGKLWLNTGIVNEDGINKEAFETCYSVLEK